MADISKTVAIIFEGQNNTSAALASVESGIKGVGNEAGAATGKVNQLDDQVSKIGGNSARIESLSNAFRALAAAVVVKEFIDANVELQKFERAMVLLKGSTEGAATEFEYVRELSRRLGLELFTTADAYTSLTAATKGTSLQGQATRDIFEAVSIAMSSLGQIQRRHARRALGYFADRQQGQCQPGRTARPVGRAPARCVPARGQCNGHVNIRAG